MSPAQRLLARDSRAVPRPCAALLLAAVVAAAGCGPGRPELAPVEGVVRFAGKPVEQGVVTFYPAAGRPATGSLGPGGRYRLTTYESGDGALVGAHKVVIEAALVRNAAPPPASFAEEVSQSQVARPAAAPKVEWLAPEKYSQIATSNLEADVKPGDNVIDFNLSQ